MTLLELSPDLRAFDDEIRTWVQENAPQGLDKLVDWSTPWGSMGRHQLVEEARLDPLCAEWERRLLEAGYVCAHWPVEYGGRGWDPVRHALFERALADANVPGANRGFGEWLVGPSVLLEGTPAQKAAFLPRIVSGEDVYCQGFSEPDHGSDLASLETRGVVDGDEIVITGQKIWTSDAHRANMVFVLCRTDRTAPKHRGISFVLVPFTPANHVEVRQIKMLNGIGEFCEDFFDEARAPLDNVIGGLNNGWRVAMTALGYERGGAATMQHLSYLPEVLALIEQARRVGRLGDPIVRQRLAWAYTQVELMRYSGLRTMARLLAGRAEEPLEAVNKLHWSEYHRRLGEYAVELDDSCGLIRPEGPGYALSRWQDLLLSTRADTIYSGTSEIQRNIIAERVLGLPKEPRAEP